MIHKIYLYIPLFFLFFVSNTSFSSEKNDNKKAMVCTKIEQKIQRLICFDNVFSTPIYGVKYNTDKPKSWIRATKRELERGSRVEPLLTLDDKSSDIWVTIPAVNIKNDITPPVLILSCIGGISRIELALYEPLERGRVKIFFKNNVEESWRSDDTGFLLSSRRGDFAKKSIKNILLKDELTISSDYSLIDGLKFSTLGLNTILSPIRERCSW